MHIEQQTTPKEVSHLASDTCAPAKCPEGLGRWRLDGAASSSYLCRTTARRRGQYRSRSKAAQEHTCTHVKFAPTCESSRMRRLRGWDEINPLRLPRNRSVHGLASLAGHLQKTPTSYRIDAHVIPPRLPRIRLTSCSTTRDDVVVLVKRRRRPWGHSWRMLEAIVDDNVGNLGRYA